MRGRVGAPSQGVRLGSVTKCVADRTGLNPGTFLFGTEVDNMVQVFRPVDHNCDVAALAGETGSASSRKQRGAELATCSECLNHVLLGLGNHHTDGNLTIVGAIGGIDSSASRIEANLAGDHFPQGTFQRSSIHLLRTIPPGLRQFLWGNKRNTTRRHHSSLSCKTLSISLLQFNSHPRS